MFKTILIARTGSGMNFCRKLLENGRLTVAKSYTTRKRANETDTGHYFLDEDPVLSEKKDFLKTDTLLKTEHGGNVYFYTREELEKADVIPIDPENIDALCALFPDIIFRFAMIAASDEDRLTAAVKNTEDKILAEEEFVLSCEEENKAFCKFEDTVKDNSFSVSSGNLLQGRITNNDFTDTADIYSLPELIRDDMRVFRLTKTAVKDLIANNQITQNDDGTVQVFEKEKGPQNVPIDRFVETVLIDNEGMATIMRNWLALKSTAEKFFSEILKD